MVKKLVFNVGEPVSVKCKEGKLIITPDTSRAELIKVVKAFKKAETKKLHEKFHNEKNELHAKFVAERKVGYGV